MAKQNNHFTKVLNVLNTSLSLICVDIIYLLYYYLSELDLRYRNYPVVDAIP